MKERKKESEHKRMHKKQQSAGFQQHGQRHRRFVPLMSDTFYNCEFCGVGIAVYRSLLVDMAKDNSRFAAHVLKNILTRKLQKSNVWLHFMI
jgi:hypothetical protein